MSSRPRNHDRRLLRRSLRIQHERHPRTVAPGEGDLWCGYWAGPQERLREYARAGCAEEVKEHLDNFSATPEELTHALVLAESGWRNASDGAHRSHFVSTMGVLLAAGADEACVGAAALDALERRPPGVTDAGLLQRALPN